MYLSSAALSPNTLEGQPLPRQPFMAIGRSSLLCGIFLNQVWALPLLAHGTILRQPPFGSTCHVSRVMQPPCSGARGRLALGVRVHRLGLLLGLRAQPGDGCRLLRNNVPRPMPWGAGWGQDSACPSMGFTLRPKRRWLVMHTHNQGAGIPALVSCLPPLDVLSWGPGLVLPVPALCVPGNWWGPLSAPSRGPGILPEACPAQHAQSQLPFPVSLCLVSEASQASSASCLSTHGW